MLKASKEDMFDNPLPEDVEKRAAETRLEEQRLNYAADEIIEFMKSLHINYREAENVLDRVFVKLRDKMKNSLLR